MEKNRTQFATSFFLSPERSRRHRITRWCNLLWGFRQNVPTLCMMTHRTAGLVLVLLATGSSLSCVCSHVGCLCAGVNCRCSTVRAICSSVPKNTCAASRCVNGRGTKGRHFSEKIDALINAFCRTLATWGLNGPVDNSRPTRCKLESPTAIARGVSMPRSHPDRTGVLWVSQSL